jgi:hypothetical protein
MNRDSVLEQVNDNRLRRVGRCRFLFPWKLECADDDAAIAAIAAFQSRVLASDADRDLRRFLAHGDTPRTSRARVRLWELVQLWPSALVTDRGGKDRR